MIAKLFYLTKSRPDISYSIWVFNRFMNKPQVPHLHVVKQIYRYLKCTTDHGTIFQKIGSKNIKGFTNIDWVGDQESRWSWSTSRYMFQLAYIPITWSNKCQLIMAIMSFTKVEYRSLVEGSKESTWLKNSQLNWGFQRRSKQQKIGDNMNCFKIAKNPILHSPAPTILKYIIIMYVNK